jgi:hypothetical protein
MGASRALPLWRSVAAILLAVACYHSATAASPAALPTFNSCEPATAPQLPPRWRAVGLMMPFERGQLDVGEFIYDSTVPALRARVYGLESGAVDLLITNKGSYLIDTTAGSSARCTSLGAELRPPSAQWLTSLSVCVGESPLGAHAVQWWQKPGFDPTRYWFSNATHLPWRALFLSRSLDPAIIGDYAMTYFPVFTPLPATDLAALRHHCAATARPIHAAHLSPTPTARDLMTLGNKTAEAERSKRIDELIPGLSLDACSRMKPPRWPDHFVTTALVTPIRITDNPYSALIYYDWSDARTQVVLPFQGSPPVQQGIISLKDRVGYRMKFSSSNRPSVCAAVLPGIVKPNWMTAASCQCRGVLARNSALSPNADTQILSCPIKTQGNRTMWSWYTTEGEPTLFFEAAPQGTGVMLADYHDWLPGQTGRPSDFALPQACEPSDPSAAEADKAPASFANTSCSDCHTTQW